MSEHNYFNDRKSFNFNKHYWDVFEKLDDENAGKLIKCLAHHQFTGEELIIDGLANFAWIGLRSLSENQINSFLKGKERTKKKNSDTVNRRSKEYKKWRINILQRDNYTCQHCHETSEILDVHHIKPILTHPELALELDNGLSLCKTCHIKVHSKNK